MANQTGVIRWEIEKDSISKENIFSQEIEVGRMTWRAGAYTNADDEHLSFFVFIKEGPYTFRSVEAELQFRMINNNDDWRNVKETCVSNYDTNIHYSGYSKFVKWETVVNENENFIKDNKFILQVDISLLNVSGYSKLHRIDFTDRNEINHDVTLVIEGEKVYSNKQFLSIHSPVFHAMFYGEFAEKNQEEIELKDIDRMEFIEMLNVIYPPYFKITYENIYFLLKLSDFYKVNVVTNRCEQYLIAGSHERFTRSHCLLLAGRYRLVNLQDHCLDQLKSTSEVKDLKNTEYYKDYTDEIYLALFHKMMSLTD